MSDPDQDERRRRRAATMTVRKLALGDEEPLDDLVFGLEGMSLTAGLSRTGHALAGHDVSRVPRDRWPIVRRDLHDT